MFSNLIFSSLRASLLQNTYVLMLLVQGDPVVLDDEDEIEVKEITASLDDIDNW